MIVNDDETIFVYKLVADNGGAPCVYGEKLSLCICKPRIRKSAVKNDWIVGFGGKSVPDLCNRLIYIAQVTEKLSDGEYYKNSKYAQRPDCIYQWNEYEKNYDLKKGAIFHADGDCLDHDIGVYPNYDRAFSLISNKFVYLGDTLTYDYKDLFKTVTPIYESLPRDFVKNITDDERRILVKFIEEIINKFGYGKRGTPTHADTTKKCNTSEGIIQESTIGTNNVIKSNSHQSRC